MATQIVTPGGANSTRGNAKSGEISRKGESFQSLIEMALLAMDAIEERRHLIYSISSAGEAWCEDVSTEHGLFASISKHLEGIQAEQMLRQALESIQGAIGGHHG